MYFAVVDGLLYFVDQKAGNRRRVVVLAQECMLDTSLVESYRAQFVATGGVLQFTDMSWNSAKTPDCAVVCGTGRKHVPPLHSIPVQHLFQIFGMDIMELPITEKGNHCHSISRLFSH